MAFDAYMPVMLAVMEIPGCLVALYLVARLRHKGMDADGNMPDEPGYVSPVPAKVRTRCGRHGRLPGQELDTERERGIEEELELALEKRRIGTPSSETDSEAGPRLTVNCCGKSSSIRVCFCSSAASLIGFVSGLQGHEGHARRRQLLFVGLPGRALPLLARDGHDGRPLSCKDLRSRRPRDSSSLACWHRTSLQRWGSSSPTATPTSPIPSFKPGTYVLFAVLCGAASYIAVPAVQRLAIPEASPTLPLAASLGLTFSYNVTIGIPLYIEIARAIGHWFPVT